MFDGEDPVVELTLESLQADMKAESTLLRELATTREGYRYCSGNNNARWTRRGVGLDVGVAAVAGVAAKTLKSYASRLSRFAEFCHDSENFSPLEATIAFVVRYVAWIGKRGHIEAKSLQPYLSAINTFFELHDLDPIAKDSMYLTAARRGLLRYGNAAWGCPFASSSAY
eukprot:jgi/Tetstr1/461418/TSEL_006528.t1